MNEKNVEKVQNNTKIDEIYEISKIVFLYYSYSSGNDNSETIFQQIVYLVNHYGDVHSLGIGLLIGITFFNIIMSFDIQKQLAKIRNILNEKK